MVGETYRLGVDLGSSNTVAAVCGPDGRVRPLLFDGSPLLPSAVFAGPDARLLVGADALRAAVGSPAGLEPNPKRRIDDRTVWLGEREHPVAGLLAAVLARVAAEAHRVAGPDAALPAVLTHPATWGRHRLATLTEAAAAAGLGEVAFVPEPVAAAAYFARVLDQRIAPQRCIVVYDLGAGTFDVSVVRPSPGGFTVVAADGLPDVGGLDLDAAVVRHARALTGGAAEAWARLDWPQQPADQQARLTLWQAARAVKEQLSRHSSSDLYLPLIDRQIHVTREEFEKAAGPHLERTAELTRAVLAREGVPPEDIAGVFLVGGSSRIPLAATLLHRALRISPTIIDQPELVVAEGALHASAVAPVAPVVAAPTAPVVAAPTAPVVVAPPVLAPVVAAAPTPVSRPAVPRTAPPARNRGATVSLSIVTVLMLGIGVAGLFLHIAGMVAIGAFMGLLCLVALVGSIVNAGRAQRS
jgi:molecular chaperone DnaK (HSP70)